MRYRGVKFTATLGEAGVKSNLSTTDYSNSISIHSASTYPLPKNGVRGKKQKTEKDISLERGPLHWSWQKSLRANGSHQLVEEARVNRPGLGANNQRLIYGAFPNTHPHPCLLVIKHEDTPLNIIWCLVMKDFNSATLRNSL